MFYYVNLVIFEINPTTAAHENGLIGPNLDQKRPIGPNLDTDDGSPR